MPTKLIKAIEKGCVETVLGLLETRSIRVKASENNNQALFEAVRSGNGDIASILLNIPSVSSRVESLDDPVVQTAVINGDTNLFNQLLILLSKKNRVNCSDYSILAKAAQSGNFDIFSKILSIIGEENAASSDNLALNSAAERGHLEILHTLYQIPNVCQKDLINGNRALILAVQNGHVEIVNYFLDIPILIEIITLEMLLCMLRDSIELGHYQVVMRLLEIAENQYHLILDIHFKIDIMRLAVINKDANTFNTLLADNSVKAHIIHHAQTTDLLHLAAEYGFMEVVVELLNIPQIKQKAHSQRNAALRMAAKNGHEEIALILLKLDKVKIAAHANANEALVGAAEHGCLGLVECLLELENVRLRAHTPNNLPVRMAATNGHINVVEKLLELYKVKADITKDRNAMLCNAVKNRNLPLIQLLLTDHKVREEAEFALRTSFNENDLDIVNYLLEVFRIRGEMIAHPILLKAIEKGNVHEVQRLLSNKNVFKYVTAGKNSALFRAIQYKHQDIIELLLSIPSVKESLVKGKSYEMFYAAAKYNALAVIQCYLDKPKLIPRNGEVIKKALVIAAKKGHYDVFMLLLNSLAKEVDVSLIVQDDKGAWYCERQGLLEIAAGSNIDIVNHLLTIKSIISKLPNYDLYPSFVRAIINQKFNVAIKLLEMPKVRQDIANRCQRNNNFINPISVKNILSKIVGFRQSAILSQLLKIDEVVSETHIDSYRDEHRQIHVRGDVFCVGLSVSKGDLETAEMLLKNTHVQQALETRPESLLMLFRQIINYFHDINLPEEFIDEFGDIAGAARREPTYVELKLLQTLLSIMPYTEQQLLERLPRVQHDIFETYHPKNQALSTMLNLKGVLDWYSSDDIDSCTSYPTCSSSLGPLLLTSNMSTSEASLMDDSSDYENDGLTTNPKRQRLN
jgi:ankyrin repeat protein